MKEKIEVDTSFIIWCIEKLHQHTMPIRELSQKKVHCSEMYRHAAQILSVRKKLKQLINYFDESETEKSIYDYHRTRILEERGEGIINRKKR